MGVNMYVLFALQYYRVLFITVSNFFSFGSLLNLLVVPISRLVGVAQRVRDLTAARQQLLLLPRICAASFLESNRIFLARAQIHQQRFDYYNPLD